MQNVYFCLILLVTAIFNVPGGSPKISWNRAQAIISWWTSKLQTRQVVPAMISRTNKYPDISLNTFRIHCNNYLRLNTTQLLLTPRAIDFKPVHFYYWKASRFCLRLIMGNRQKWSKIIDSTRSTFTWWKVNTLFYNARHIFLSNWKNNKNPFYYTVFLPISL